MVSRTVAMVYVLSKTTVPPLLQLARAALIAGPSSDVPPATSQVVAMTEVTATLARANNRSIEKEDILEGLTLCSFWSDSVSKSYEPFLYFSPQNQQIMPQRLEE